MYPILKSNLGKRIVLLVGIGMLLVVGILVISGLFAVRQSSDLVSHERQALAQATRGSLEYILRQNLERLENVRMAEGVNIQDNDLGPEKSALHSTYLGSIFDGGVFLTDQQGTVIWTEPVRWDLIGTNISSYQTIEQGLSLVRPLISDVFTFGANQIVLMVTPLRNAEGQVVGLVGGQINPLNRSLPAFAQAIWLGETSHIDVVDSRGIVLASSQPGRILQDASSTSDQKPEITVSAPLSFARWSVVVGQSEEEALAPVRSMELRFLLFSLAAVTIALFLSWGMARSVVLPLAQLTTATRNIAQGDLSQMVHQPRNDEIGELSRSFDAMRIALKKSMAEVQQWNRELEKKVAERTSELETLYREMEQKEGARGKLLRKVLTAQEEERRRIARELHDETSQSLAGLVMRLEAATSNPDESTEKVRGMLADIKKLAVRTIDNVHKIIFDLRPSVLDDLGLLSALRWYTENRLGETGVKTRIEVTGEEKKQSPQIETALFRVVQEAITNIVKHAEAQNVVLSVEFKDNTIGIEVEDDGKGFDVRAVSLRGDKAQGLGLLGMKERVTLLGGQFNIESQPGGGTHLSVEVPLS